MNQPELQDDGETVICHQCENPYTRIGYHWSNGRCSYPEIPEYKQELIDGLMLGDGTLRTHTKNPFVQTYMINQPFLEWLDTQLGWLSTGVSLYRTAEKSAEHSRNNGHPDADPEDYHDVYVMQTRSMDAFKKYESWYSGGNGKRFPDTLTISPQIARIWYSCDGSLNYDRRYPSSRPHATIGVQNEMSNIQNVLRMFNESTLNHQPEVDEHTIRFNVEETEDLLEWMGSPPPGFEYKWMNDNFDQYKALKQEAYGEHQLETPETQL